MSKTKSRRAIRQAARQCASASLVERLENRVLLSSAQFLADLNDASPDSAPSQFTSFAGSEYFIATIGNTSSSPALMKTDGTASGTSVVKRFPVGASLSGLQVNNGSMSFTDRPAQLWVSDGTPSGTHTVAALPASASPYDQHDFYAFGGFILFAANDGTHDGLWRTNGAGAPTQVKAISVKSFFVTINGVAYFTADDGQNGVELWATDGTTGGTSMVIDLAAGSASAQIAGLAAVNGELYFTANPTNAGRPSLYKSDGTAPGTQLVVSNVNEGVGVGNLYYYADPFYLWRTDGTPQGTFTIGNVNNLGGIGNPPAEHLMAFNNLLIFAGFQPATGAELWRSDGTDAGTYLLKDIDEGNGSYWLGDYTKRSTSEFMPIGNTLFFNAYSGDNGIELWKTDGTSNGTSLVKDINPGFGYSSPNQLTDFNGKLLFSADDGLHGLEPWISDGTTGGTTMITDVNNYTFSSNPDDLLSLGGRILFTATDDTNHRNLYASDGTVSGTSVILTLGVAGASDLYNFATDGSIAYFVDSNYKGTSTLFVTDGTAAGTHPCGGNSTIIYQSQSMAVLNGKCFYIAVDSSHGNELWVSDGSTAALFDDISPGQPSAFSTQSYAALTNLGGSLYFIADDGVHGAELWTSDGTVGGTHLIKDIAPGTGSSAPSYLTLYKGQIYFSANDSVHGYELWSSDGTAGGTQMVKELVPGASDSAPRDLTVSGNYLFFDAAVPTGISYERQILRTDGTAAGTIVLKSTNGGLDPRDLIDLDGTLYFSAHGFPRTGIWKSDGTPAGTMEIYDAFADHLPDNIYQATTAAGKLYWQASVQTSSGPGSIGLWMSNGTAAGTMLVPGLAPPGFGGFGSNSGIAFNGSNGTIFFRYTDDTHGNEMWIVTPDNSPQEPGGFTLSINGGSVANSADAPTAAAAVATETITLKWTHGSDMNGYRLQRSTDPAFSHIDATFTIPANFKQYTDIVPAGANYYYRLVAYNPHGSSPAAIAGTITPPATGSIAGIVYNDANANGTRDTGEAGLAGVRVYLDQNSNGVFDAAETSVLTDATGAFKFTNLATGTYHLREVIPVGLKITAPAGGVFNAVLTSGEAIANENFGDAKIPTTASISGTIFNDANGDGKRQSTEKGLSGWKVYLDSNNNGKLDTGERMALTDSSGNYTFTGLTAGTYHVREVIQSGWRAVGVSSFTIALGATNVTSKVFAVSQTALVSGTIFKDANHNGLFDTGDSGLSGWRVYVDANNDGVWESSELSTLTAANGSFSLTLGAGTYHLRVVAKSGFTRTAPATGVYTVTLAKGQTLTGKNFGYR